jgi:Flp pilus assembly protein TadD
MLRVIPLTLAILISNAAIAAAEPQAGEDLATCRDRQAEAQARATACDNLLKADKLGGKDKSLALVVRGNALINKRDYDRAIEALSSAIDLDPDNVGAINLRGLSHERKGEDDLAMVDYNLAIQTIAAPSICAGARCKARSTTSTCQSNTRPRSCSAGPIGPACAR